MDGISSDANYYSVINENLEKRLISIEKKLNHAGYIFIGVAQVSGTLRFLIGVIQVIAATCFLAAAICQRVRFPDQAYDYSIDHLKHGGGNMLRALVEVVGLSIFLACFHDSTPDQRMSYESEVVDFFQ